MIRFAVCLGFFAMTLAGCGKSTEPQVAQQSPDASQPAPSGSSQPTPTDVVSQFLDEVRRGGEDSRANEFLTERARAALTKIGQSIQPIGSPDARYQVTRAEEHPDDPNSVLVHSIWSEPLPAGQSNDVQVVWAVQREPAGWRISGLAIEVDSLQEPVVLDFENAELMARHLAPPAAAAEPQATAPAATIAR